MRRGGGFNRSGFNNLVRRMRAARQNAGQDASGGYYYWIVGMKQGQRYVGGPYADENSAKSVARDSLDELRWKIVPLHTRDAQKAKAILRHTLVSSGASIDEAMQPMHRPTNITSVD